MKKTVRLTESDLNRIVRKVINEGVKITVPLQPSEIKNAVAAAGAITKPGEQEPQKKLAAEIFYNTDEQQYVCKIGDSYYDID
jgi:hypothetical protein